MSRSIPPLVVALLVLGVGGCGDASPAPSTRVEVTLAPVAWGGCDVSTPDGCSWTPVAATVTVDCDGGRLADAVTAAVCEALLGDASLVSSSAVACPDAAARVLVRGRVAGERVDVTLSTCGDADVVQRWSDLLGRRLVGPDEVPV